jgi:hypothetical protein
MADFTFFVLFDENIAKNVGPERRQVMFAGLFVD